LIGSLAGRRWRAHCFGGSDVRSPGNEHEATWNMLVSHSADTCCGHENKRFLGQRSHYGARLDRIGTTYTMPR
jgi:hypothetical protein